MLQRGTAGHQQWHPARGRAAALVHSAALGWIGLVDPPSSPAPGPNSKPPLSLSRSVLGSVPGCRLMLKYVRIAVTAFSLTACVLLFALWVRSYTWTDDIRWRVSETGTLKLHCGPGKLSLSWFPVTLWDWAWITRSSQELAREQEEVALLLARIGQTMQPESSFAFRWSDQYFYVRSPHWFLLILFGCSAVLVGIPWINWRFSLRTLLIATTLIAVGLGAVI